TDVNGTLFFTFDDGTSNNLYKLVDDKPVRVGTTKGGTSGGTSPAFLTAVGSTLYFSGLDLQGKARLFQSDGSTITLAPGDTGTDPTSLTNASGSLFFEATDTSHGSELHALSTTPAPPPTP